MKSLLGIGNAIADIFVDLKDDSFLRHFGLLFGRQCHIERAMHENIKEALNNEYADSAHVRTVVGGSTANTVRGIALLGMNTGFLGMIGTDEMGDLYDSQMSSLDINVSLFRGTLPTGCSYIFHFPNSKSSTIVTYRGATLELKPEDIYREIFNNYDYFHTESFLLQNRVLFSRALTLASEAGCIISLDLSATLPMRINANYVQKAISDYVDIVFASEEEAYALTNTTTPKKALELLSHICDVAVLKMGERGSMVRKGDDVYVIPAIPVHSTNINLVGAGDAYAAGFLKAHSLELPIIECAYAGSEYAHRHIIGE